MSAWIDDPRDDDPVWWPICEKCDDDATHLAPPQDNPWWVFICDRHSRLGDRTIQQVRDGLRPQVQGRAWAAAWAAIQGVPKPTDEELSFYAPQEDT